VQADTEAVLARLRRIEGQMRGLQRMVDADAYCIDILTQISAAMPRPVRARSKNSPKKRAEISTNEWRLSCAHALDYGP
jgi:hypothetical protein